MLNKEIQKFFHDLSYPAVLPLKNGDIYIFTSEETLYNYIDEHLSFFVEKNRDKIASKNDAELTKILDMISSGDKYEKANIFMAMVTSVDNDCGFISLTENELVGFLVHGDHVVIKREEYDQLRGAQTLLANYLRK